MKAILKVHLNTVRSGTLLKDIFRIVEHGLTYAYTLSWNCVLNLLGDLFELLGKESFELCENVRKINNFMECNHVVNHCHSV